MAASTNPAQAVRKESLARSEDSGLQDYVQGILRADSTSSVEFEPQDACPRQRQLERRSRYHPITVHLGEQLSQRHRSQLELPDSLGLRAYR